MKKLETLTKIISILFIIGFLFYWPRFVIIEQVECISQFGECSPVLYELYKKMEGKSLYKSFDIAKKIYKSESLIRDYSLSYKFPKSLSVVVNEKKPMYALSAKDRKPIAILDKNGEVIYFLDTSNLKVVVSDKEIPSVGNRVDDKTLFALKIVYLVNLYYDIHNAHLESDRLVFFSNDNIKVIFPLDGDLYKLVGSYNLIRGRIKNITKDIINSDDESFEIDLRFKNPIIRFI